MLANLNESWDTFGQVVGDGSGALRARSWTGESATESIWSYLSSSSHFSEASSNAWLFLMSDLD